MEGHIVCLFNYIHIFLTFVALSRICVIAFIIIFIIIYPALSLEPKLLGKDQQFHSFFPLDIYENTL